MIRTPGLAPWIAPSAADLPDLRIQLYEQSRNVLFTNEFLMRIKLGQCPLVPIANSRSATVSSLEVVCSQVVGTCELLRLRQAELFWMDEGITTLAAAANPSREPVGALRMPADSGLMLFAQPIGGVDFSVSMAMTGPWSTAVAGLSDELRVESPIVAVSWSRWSPADLEFVDAPSATRWALKHHDGSTTLCRTTSKASG